MAYQPTSGFFPQQQMNPYMPQFPTQRYLGVEQPTIPQGFLKGRPVSSIDEARVAQIDFDGSLNIFTDIANKKIYTKQINMDGTSNFNIYCLTAPEPEKPSAPAINLDEYVTKNELNTLLSQLTSTITAIEQKIQKKENAEAGSKF